MSTEPLPDPVVEPTIAAVAEPVVEPTAELATEPVVEATAEPIDHSPIDHLLIDHLPIVESPMATSPVTVAIPVAAAPAGTIGRYSHADLYAMVGKRGRKPPEFYLAFPRDENAALVAKNSVKPTKSDGPKKARLPRAKALPAVSSAVIGEHTIDELLAMIGTTGRKPVAFEILEQAAQVFVDAQAIDLPSAPVDPLVTAFAAAPKGVREAITALLAATKKR